MPRQGSPLTPEQRSLRARAAAYARWSREDPAENVRRGQAGLQQKFRDDVDREFPDLPEAERDRRARAAFRAHMAKLALASSRSRAKAGAA